MVCTFLKAFLQACFVCWKLRTWKTCAVLTRRVFHGRLTEREREREMEGGGMERKSMCVSEDLCLCVCASQLSRY